VNFIAFMADVHFFCNSI